MNKYSPGIIELYFLHAMYAVTSEFTYAYVVTLHLLLENLWLFPNATVILCYIYICDFCCSMYVYIYLGKHRFLSYFTEGDI